MAYTFNRAADGSAVITGDAAFFAKLAVALHAFQPGRLAEELASLRDHLDVTAQAATQATSRRVGEELRSVHLRRKTDMGHDLREDGNGNAQ